MSRPFTLMKEPYKARVDAESRSNTRCSTSGEDVVLPSQLLFPPRDGATIPEKLQRKRTIHSQERRRPQRGEKDEDAHSAHNIPHDSVEHSIILQRLLSFQMQANLVPWAYAFLESKELFVPKMVSFQ